MITITEKNYFDLNNRGLSQSKIKDYGIDPNYCYRKNISGELVREETDAFAVGKEVDGLLTEIDKLSQVVVFEKDCRVTANKLEKQAIIDSGKQVITKAQYDQIVALADAVDKTSAYHTIKTSGYIFQEIIQIKADLGEYFDCYYGKPDAYKIEEDGTCDLVDLKTSRGIGNNQYYYNAYELGYFKQLWFYSFLLQQKYPKIKRFRYWNLVAEKKEPFLVKLYSIPKEYVIAEENAMIELIDRIKNDKEFKKTDASFENPSILTNPKEFAQ